MKKQTSVIVIAYNEERYIGGCIRSLMHQTFEDFRLIIVNDGSTDGTEQAVRQFKDPRIIYIKHSIRTGFATARNTGLLHAAHSIVFFTDADCCPRQHWIEKGLAALEDDTDIVGGRTIYENAENRFSLNVSEFHSFPWPNPSTNNMACRYSTIEAMGFFDKRYNYGMEDADFILRAVKKHKIKICEDMVVVHMDKKYDTERKTMWIKRAHGLILLIKDHNKYLDSARFKEQYRKATCGKIYVQQRYRKIGFLRIAKPFHLAGIFFFPIVFILLKEKNIKLLSARGALYALMTYAYFIISRLIIWRYAAQEKFFVI